MFSRPAEAPRLDDYFVLPCPSAFIRVIRVKVFLFWHGPAFAGHTDDAVKDQMTDDRKNSLLFYLAFASYLQPIASDQTPSLSFELIIGRYRFLKKYRPCGHGNFRAKVIRVK